MKVIYPTNGIWDGSNQLIDNDEPVPTGFTAVQPPQPNYAVKWDGERWAETATADQIGAWQADHSTVIDETEPEPTAEQLSITALAQQSADHAQHIQSIEEAITSLAQSQITGGTN